MLLYATVTAVNTGSLHYIPHPPFHYSPLTHHVPSTSALSVPAHVINAHLPKCPVPLDCISLPGKLSTAEETIDLILQPFETDANNVTGSHIPQPEDNRGSKWAKCIKEAHFRIDKAIHREL